MLAVPYGIFTLHLIFVSTFPPPVYYKYFLGELLLSFFTYERPTRVEKKNSVKIVQVNSEDFNANLPNSIY